MNLTPPFRNSLLVTIGISLLVANAFVVLQPIHSLRYNLFIVLSSALALLVFGLYLFLNFRKYFYVFIFVVTLPLLVNFNRSTIDPIELKTVYISQLRSFVGTSYVWGGENCLGIDCSGLPRKSMINALWMYGVFHFNGVAIQKALYYWWYDASALELIGGYGGNAIVYSDVYVINEGNLKALPGDMAITKGGIHVMVYLDKSQIIQAEPDRGNVVIDQLPEGGSPWYNVKVKLVRWSLLN